MSGPRTLWAVALLVLALAVTTGTTWACTQCAEHFTCYFADTFDPEHTVSIDGDSRVETVSVGDRELLCTPTGKIVLSGPASPNLEIPLNDLVCYQILPVDSTDPDVIALLTDRFGIQAVNPGPSRFLCVASCVDDGSGTCVGASGADGDGDGTVPPGKTPR